MSAVVPQPVSLVRAVGHLCAVDLRRFRWLVAGVAGLELVRAILVEWSLQLAPLTTMVDAPPAGADMAVPLLDFGILLTTAIGTGILVQADHPTDDRAFWRTLPIPPLAVALAKVATLALLFVGVPAAMNAMRLAAYGAPAVAIVAATVQIAVLAGVVIRAGVDVAVADSDAAALPRRAPRLIVAGYLVARRLIMMLLSVTSQRPRPILVPIGLGLAAAPAWLGWCGSASSRPASAAWSSSRRTTPSGGSRSPSPACSLLVLVPSLVRLDDAERAAPADLAGRVARQLTLPQGWQALSSSRRPHAADASMSPA